MVPKLTSLTFVKMMELVAEDRINMTDLKMLDKYTRQMFKDVISLSFVPNFAPVTKLDLTESEITTLRGIDGLINLEDLVLQNIGTIKTTDCMLPLFNLKKLKYLDLANTRNSVLRTFICCLRRHRARLPNLEIIDITAVGGDNARNVDVRTLLKTHGHLRVIKVRGTRSTMTLHSTSSTTLITTKSYADCVRALEDCLKNGSPCKLEGIEKWDDFDGIEMFAKDRNGCKYVKLHLLALKKFERKRSVVDNLISNMGEILYMRNHFDRLSSISNEQIEQIGDITTTLMRQEKSSVHQRNIMSIWTSVAHRIINKEHVTRMLESSLTVFLNVDSMDDELSRRALCVIKKLTRRGNAHLELTSINQPEMIRRIQDSILLFDDRKKTSVLDTHVFEALKLVSIQSAATPNPGLTRTLFAWTKTTKLPLPMCKLLFDMLNGSQDVDEFSKIDIMNIMNSDLLCTERADKPILIFYVTGIIVRFMQFARDDAEVQGLAGKVDAKINKYGRNTYIRRSFKSENFQVDFSVVKDVLDNAQNNAEISWATWALKYVFTREAATGETYWKDHEEEVMALYSRLSNTDKEVIERAEVVSKTYDAELDE